MNRRAHWQSVYESKNETDLSWFQERPESSLRMMARGGVDKGARIVDVGGGASRLVDCLIDLGYVRVTVLDIADAALQKARARLDRRSEHVAWITADVTRWEASEPFDLWHDRAVLHFLTDAADRQAYVATLAKCVRSGGQVIIGTFAPDGPERCSGLPVRRYDASGLAAELGPRFRLVDTLVEDHLTPGGKIQKFQFCRLNRV